MEVNGEVNGGGKRAQNPDGFFLDPRTKTRAIQADSEAKPHRYNEAVLPAAPGNTEENCRRLVNVITRYRTLRPRSAAS